MSTIKVLDKFIPTPPPYEASKPMREWLREEFDRMAAVANGVLEVVDALEAVPRMFLAGQTDDFNLDTIDSKFVNYPEGGALGVVPIDPDKVLGEITIPISGLYRITAYVYGQQLSVVQNESIRMVIDVDTVKAIVASIDVTSNQTSDRYLAVTMTRLLSAGHVVSMWLNATADMGTFDVISTTLEITFVTLGEQQEAQINEGALTGMNWPP